MRNALIFHVASGQAFFSGILLVLFSTVRYASPDRRYLAFARSISASLGLILIVLSSTPLPTWYSITAGAATAAWIFSGGLSGSTAGPRRRMLKLALIGIWGLGLILEVPYHRVPPLSFSGREELHVVGDSLAADEGREESWPQQLARRHRITLQNHATTGATASTALRSQVSKISGGSSLILIEIGGNDLLNGTSARIFERNLDALIGQLRRSGHRVVMLELPLPPFFQGYGKAQRRVAKRWGAVLIPKRVLMGVLASDGATVDSVHLSPRGHSLMAKAIWDAIRGAFSR